MPRLTLIAATASSTSNTELNLQSYKSAIVGADNLAGAETVTFKIAGKGITDLTGTAKQLTAAIPSMVIEGGVVYQVDKTATAGACEVYFVTGSALNE